MEHDVVIVAGVPGTGERGADLYPDSTADVVKLLRGLNVAVGFEEADPDSRQRLVLMNDHLWLPVLVVNTLGPLGMAVTANLIADMITDLVASRQRARVHIKTGVREHTGTIRWLETEGTGIEVRQALQQFYRATDQNDDS